MLAHFDKAFSRYEKEGTERFSKGRNIFDGQPARIGFVVAVAQYVLGRPGQDRIASERQARIEKLNDASKVLIAKLNSRSAEDVGNFLKLDVLSEIIDRKVGQVGRYERSVFSEGFKVLVEEMFDVPTMEPCWRAN